MVLPAIPDWLSYQAAVNARALALKFFDQTWTFADLDEAVARTAGALRTLGLRSGDRLAFSLAPGPHAVMVVHAALRLGLTLVPLNTRLTPAELQPIVIDADPSCLITDAPLLGLAVSCRVVTWEEVRQCSAVRPVPGGDLHPEELAALVYTSGTTGTPKGVEITVGNIWASAVASGLHAGIEADDRWFHAMPLFHVSGLSILYRSVVHGSGIVLAARFDAAETVRSLHRDRITLLSVVPTMLRRLMDATSGPLGPDLRMVLLGGAPASPSLVQEALERGIPVVTTYGLTETFSQIATLRPGDLPERMGSSGHALLPSRVAIAVNGHLATAPNTVGEIWVKGPSVCRGYWRRPEMTRAAFHDGWFKTGDMGTLDADGYLTVLDRRRDLIISGGENVYPTEVENSLLTLSMVDDAAVFAEPDIEWGQKVAAALATSAPLSVSELKAALAGRLARYKIPRVIYLVPSIPRTASGKILRHVLPEWVHTHGQRLEEGPMP